MEVFFLINVEAAWTLGEELVAGADDLRIIFGQRGLEFLRELLVLFRVEMELGVEGLLSRQVDFGLVVFFLEGGKLLEDFLFEGQGSLFVGKVQSGGGGLLLLQNALLELLAHVFGRASVVWKRLLLLRLVLHRELDVALLEVAATVFEVFSVQRGREVDHLVGEESFVQGNFDFQHFVFLGDH